VGACLRLQPADPKRQAGGAPSLNWARTCPCPPWSWARTCPCPPWSWAQTRPGPVRSWVRACP